MITLISTKYSPPEQWSLYLQLTDFQDDTLFNPNLIRSDQNRIKCDKNSLTSGANSSHSQIVCQPNGLGTGNWREGDNRSPAEHPVRAVVIVVIVVVVAVVVDVDVISIVCFSDNWSKQNV